MYVMVEVLVRYVVKGFIYRMVSSDGKQSPHTSPLFFHHPVAYCRIELAYACSIGSVLRSIDWGPAVALLVGACFLAVPAIDSCEAEIL